MESSVAEVADERLVPRPEELPSHYLLLLFGMLSRLAGQAGPYVASYEDGAARISDELLARLQRAESAGEGN